MALTKTPIELSSTPGIVDNSNDTAITIDASENVGIGIAPSVKLEVNGGADGSVVFSGRSDGGNGNNQRFNLIAYADGGGSGYGGGLKIQARNSSNVFSDAVTVSSAGSVGIGNSSGVGKLEVYANNTAPAAYIRQDGTGPIQSWHVAGGTERMRILSTGGITFNGDTAQANALDDYEEGVATISILAASTNPSINEGNTFTGYYTKVGNVCTIVGYTGTRTFANTGSGNPRFSGLPFASKSGPYAIAQFTHNTFFTNSTAGYVETGSNYFYPIVDNSTPVASIAGTGARFLMFSLTYITA